MSSAVIIDCVILYALLNSFNLAHKFCICFLTSSILLESFVISLTK